MDNFWGPHKFIIERLTVVANSFVLLLHETKVGRQSVILAILKLKVVGQKSEKIKRINNDVQSPYWIEDVIESHGSMECFIRVDIHPYSSLYLNCKSSLHSNTCSVNEFLFQSNP